ncbi:MAG: HEPN domain-containing protein [Anaerolineae bacterium]|nr:HEPN domain-containing protein [Anaerolineae bacterium]
MILYGSFARNFAVSRGYYAMFYAAEVALLSEGLAFSKHASVIAAFGQRFARTGRVPAYLHRYLLDAFDIRQIGDYDAPGMVSRDRAGQVMVWAREFFRAVADWLGPRTQAAEGSIPDVFR